MSVDSPETNREERVAFVVSAVARQALADRGLRSVALLDDGSPEVALAERLLRAGLDEERVVRVSAAGRQLEPVLHALGARSGLDPARARVEVGRLTARLIDGAMVANPANKTALLLGGALPPDPFFPLADLYASQVRELAGGWSAPAAVEALAREAGGIDALDAALRALFEQRSLRGLDTLASPLAGEVRARLAAGAASRTYPLLVPKLGTRTIGVDLFE